jgi:hypothetical protein
MNTTTKPLNQNRMNADSKYFDKYYDYVNRGIQPETKELRAVFNIVDDLTDRRGIKHEFNKIDADIQDEIIETWVLCIKNGLM